MVVYWLRPSSGFLLLPQTLLELGASPDYKDSRGLTPLYHSVLVGGDPGCCELLLQHHAFVCCQDENGWHEVHQVSIHQGGRKKAPCPNSPPSLIIHKEQRSLI